ncbi:competence type IV pilus assembly protein ComGB [Enterococcus sp. LJL98]
MKKERKERIAFLEMFVLLLENGFSLQESLQVMERSRSFSERLLTVLTHSFTQGQSLGEGFCQMGFRPSEVLQVQLAETHGNVTETLSNLLQHLKLLDKQRTELQKIMTYPMILLLFSFSTLLSMRYLLLPQLLASQMVNPDHWGIWFMTYSPFLFGGSLLVFSLSGFCLRHLFRRKSPLEQAILLSRLPVVGSFYRLYQTSYFSLEWGKLFKEGLESKQVIQTLIALPENSLMITVSKKLNQGLAEGLSLTNQLADYPFLLPEFSLIVFQGELKGKLGEELLIYSQLVLKQFVTKVEQGIKWIQPLVFIGIALAIIAIYVAMFIPLYGNLGGDFV